MQFGALPFEYLQHLDPGGRVRRSRAHGQGIRVRRAPKP